MFLWLEVQDDMEDLPISHMLCVTLFWVFVMPLLERVATNETLSPTQETGTHMPLYLHNLRFVMPRVSSVSGMGH